MERRSGKKAFRLAVFQVLGVALRPSSIWIATTATRSAFLFGIYMKLKSEYETEVYVSQSGYFCIKQDNPLATSESLIMLTPRQMSAISLYWNKTKKDTSALFANAEEGDE